MRILTLDIETSPNVCYTWGLFDQNVGLSQIITPSRILCVAAKWYGQSKMIFLSELDGREDMIAALWDLLDEADAVVHYNGTSFDMKHINREFLEAGYNPPAPYAQIDLYTTVRGQFKFLSNKLDWVVQRLEMDAKTAHEGFGLWRKCLDGDLAAWKKMGTYNRQDVRLTEELYTALRPWIRNHPSANLDLGLNHACPTCGSVELQRRGLARTKVSTFQRFRCNECGTYSRSGKRLTGVDLRKA